ncbi:glucose-1-phosphate adenylyltransferase [Paenibacillus barengoltzii]|uniref:glucose-1-phosphate adenylyltransferase n=1 Tax=Paenibacillus TaxID=44249 RepID=UPI00048CAA46|nr:MULTISPECIES: glucose-1-phosphate adenylyltransferase [Paenibacillus]SME91456.1 glucose-1-phosphate adenylyltransferase [Paenibacillus barengoltzii]
MRKKDCIAMLLAGGEGRRLSPLTTKQAKPAVHFGGHYRIIDFPLSNCVNSGIDTIGVLTQYEAASLHEHIGEGEPWKLKHSEHGGITLLPAYREGVEEYTGTADAIYKNMAFVDGHSPKYVLILSGDHIYHMDYRHMLDFHLSHQAKATISVMPVPWEEAHRFGVMTKDEHNRITEFAEKPAQPASNLASMGIYLFEWEFLKRQLEEDAADPNSSHDFGKDLIPKMLAGSEPLHAYEFKGYWRDVGTVQSLWEAHMDLLVESSEWKLHREDWPMFTRERPLMQGWVKKRHTPAPSSLIHDHCSLEGYVERSVIFAGTEIGRYSRIKDSVIMPGAKIGRNVQIERAIIGEGAIIKDGAVIKSEHGDISVVAPYETVFAKPASRPQPSRLLQEVYDNAPRLRAEGLLS